MLIFSSYYRRERPELVRLHHTKPFTQEQLWRYAADFKTHENPFGIVRTAARRWAIARWRWSG